MKQHPLKYITVHCSATPPDMDIGVAEIRHWHQQKGWQDIGYHYVIRRCGTVEHGRPLTRPGAHVRGHNRGNIGVCLIGGCDTQQYPQDNFTLAQRKSLFLLLAELQHVFAIDDAHVCAHSQWDSGKACPVISIHADPFLPLPEKE